MPQTTNTLPSQIIRNWEKEQQTALRTTGAQSLTVARGMIVTLTRMDTPALREWAWITDTWEGHAFGDLRGYVVATRDGSELGIILQRDGIGFTHAEWLNPTTGDYEYAGPTRTLKIAANYIVDHHDHLARLAGTPRHADHDQDVLEQLITTWWESWRPVPPAPVADGTRVIYTGTLPGHHGEEFIAHPHDHMYAITSIDDDCWCTSSKYTLVSLDERGVLVHVDRADFAPAA